MFIVCLRHQNTDQQENNAMQHYWIMESQFTHNDFFYICCVPLNNNIRQLLIIVCYNMYDDVSIYFFKVLICKI